MQNTSTMPPNPENDAAFFYMATVQKPTAIAKCIQASFTCRLNWENSNQAQAIVAGGEGDIQEMPQNDVEMENQEVNQIDSSSKINQAKTGQYIMEQNLIFAQSDSLRIFTYEEGAGAGQQESL